jgi:hypothetical protein
MVKILGAISFRVGASLTRSLSIPVSPVIKAGISHSGFTKEVNSSTICSPSNLKIEISVILFPLIPFPVVSMSTIQYNIDCFIAFKVRAI